jgi:hypothetical protein
MSAEFIAFLLAPVGYLGLMMAAVQSAKRRHTLVLRRIVAAVIVTHVLLVWTVRYEWQLSEATRNGYSGFALFHAALLAIVMSVFARDRLARRLLVSAFGIVTVGAVGAVLMYDVVKVYRIPVIAIAFVGLIGLVQAYVARSEQSAMKPLRPNDRSP